ncbi:hypothetical protein KY348_07800 [Candidatus Woesearchaeota archaeon]|nr:hypothetical protein [Candidatus Woesearchaeota archaeon]
MELPRLADLKQRFLVLYEKGETISILLVGDTTELKGRIIHVGEDYITLHQEDHDRLVPLDKIKFVKMPRK